MSDRADLLRVDVTGTVHPVGRTASQEMRPRAGEWRLWPSPHGVIVMRQAFDAQGQKEHHAAQATLRMAGEIRAPGQICDVVALAAQSSLTGELVVFEGEAQRSIYLESGIVVGATTNVPEERLGETLYRFGVITREQLDTALKACGASGKRIGEAAIELEYVSPEELFPMMTRQVEEVFYASLRVASGSYFVFDKFDEAHLPRRHNLNAGAMLMEGARRMDEMSFFREKIPHDDYVPIPKAMAGGGGVTTEAKKPPDDLAALFAQCDGKRSIAEIGRRIGQLEFEVTKGVFQLVQGGFVNIGAPRPEGPEAIVEAFNPALIEIHKKCDAVGKGAELRDALGRFATSALVFDPLFFGAGPREDGSFMPARVAKNLAALAGDDPDAWLTQLLQEYVGFALFQAGSLLPREAENNLATHVSESLKPLRNTEMGGPPSKRMG